VGRRDEGGVTIPIREYLPGEATAGWPGGGAPQVEALFREMWRSLYVLALGLTGSAATAEDVVQDVFVSVQRRHPRFDGRSGAAAYLHAAVTNRCRSVHRRAYVRRRYEATQPRREPTVADHAAVSGEHVEVLDAVRRLGHRQREVLILRYWCDFSDADTARVLNISAGTVRSTLSRAHARLATMLGETT
jgi:RNA polymerase sigma factor (sigma-70 family)